MIETTDHREIRKWIKERGGQSARVKGYGKGGILRMDFGEPEDSSEPIEWNDFFEIFDENERCFLCQERPPAGRPAGSTSSYLAASTEAAAKQVRER